MLGTTEIIIILAILAFLFGGDRLKDKFVDWAKKAKQAKEEISQEINSSPDTNSKKNSKNSQDSGSQTTNN